MSSRLKWSTTMSSSWILPAVLIAVLGCALIFALCEWLVRRASGKHEDDDSAMG